MTDAEIERLWFVRELYRAAAHEWRLRALEQAGGY